MKDQSIFPSTTILSKAKFLQSASLVLYPEIHVLRSYYQSLMKLTKIFDYNPSVYIRGVFLDISKAFDKVWHDGLIFKLQTYGQQRVLLNEHTSSWKNILAGIPQESVLGPLFFLIYINDLPDELTSLCKIFADVHHFFRSQLGVVQWVRNGKSNILTTSIPLCHGM